MEETLSMEIAAALLTDYHFEDIENGKYLRPQGTFDDLLKPSLWKKLPRSFAHRFYVSLLLSEDSASGF